MTTSRQRGAAAALWLCALAACAAPRAAAAAAPPPDSIRELRAAVYLEPARGDACVRLLRADGAAGCAAPGAAPAQGPLAPAGAGTSAADIPPGTVAVVPAAEAGAFLQRAAAEPELRGRLAGVLVEHADDYPGWNAEPSAPLAEYAPYSKKEYAWNPAGTGAAAAEFPFPIFQLDNETSAPAAARAAANAAAGGAGARHAARLSLTMEAAGAAGSAACLAARACLPVGGYSVVAALPPLPEAGAEAGAAAAAEGALEGSVLLAAWMDGAPGLFHARAAAAGAARSGLVAALAAAEALGAALRADGAPPPRRRVVVAALAAEAWGLVGSRRLLWEAHAAPGAAAVGGLDLDSIAAILEVGDVGRPARGAGGAPELFAHAAGAGGGAATAALAAAAAAALAAGEPPARLRRASAAAPGAPPSSAWALGRAAPAAPAVVLTGFDAAYQEENAHGAPYDPPMDEEAVTAAVALLARAAHALAAAPGTPPLALNRTRLRATVAALAACLGDRAGAGEGLRCPLAGAVLAPEAAGAGAPPAYVGILRAPPLDAQRPDDKSDLQRFVWGFLAAAAAAAPAPGGPPPPRCAPANATRACAPGAACAGGSATGGACVDATVRYVPAWSAALNCTGCAAGAPAWAAAEGGGAAGAWEAALGFPRDPLWTESNWPDGTPRALLFLQEAPTAEAAVLAAGVVVTAAAVAVALALRLAWARRLKRD
jgi:nicastrin